MIGDVALDGEARLQPGMPFAQLLPGGGRLVQQIGHRRRERPRIARRHRSHRRVVAADLPDGSSVRSDQPPGEPCRLKVGQAEALLVRWLDIDVGLLEPSHLRGLAKPLRERERGGHAKPPSE